MDTVFGLVIGITLGMYLGIFVAEKDIYNCIERKGDTSTAWFVPAQVCSTQTYKGGN